MKEYTSGRRVVIVNRGGKGNIEQAIFILKKDVTELSEDYILDEAKKIVDEFVARNRMNGRGGTCIAKWLLLGASAVCLAVGVCAYMFL